MTHLNIQQGSNVEIVTTLIILKLYDAALSVPEPLEGELDAAYMSGNLLVGRTYRALVEYLTNRFDDLHINVTDSYYIPFEDSAVLSILLANNIGSDGIGVTEAEAANATFTMGFFENNTDITSFNTFNLFTKANTNPPIALFKMCTNLASVNLSNITTIGEEEFNGCNNLNVSLSLSGLTSLGNSAFKNSGITSITNLGSITTIPRECFRGCTSLTSVTLPSTVTSIGLWGFADCHMTTMDLSHVTSIGEEAFINSYLTTADLSNVASIGPSAFRGSRLTGTLNCPNLTSIGELAFFSTGITSVKNLGNIEYLDKWGTFGNCTNLTEFIVPISLKTFNTSTFTNDNPPNVSLLIFPYGFLTFGGADLNNVLSRKIHYLLFPSTVTNISLLGTYYLNNLSDINCTIVVQSTTPPTTNYTSNGGSFNNGYRTGKPEFAKWYVPDSALNTYLTDPDWGGSTQEFHDRIFPISQLETDSSTYWAIYLANKDYGVPTQS